jgi:hypothetical protein
LDLSEKGSPPHLASKPIPGVPLASNCPSVNAFSTANFVPQFQSPDCQETFVNFPEKIPFLRFSLKVRPSLTDFFTHKRDFHAASQRQTIIKSQAKKTHRGKKRRAASEESVSTETLGTGVPKPPPAYSRSKKFFQAAPQ